MDTICEIKEVYRAIYQYENDFKRKYKMTLNEAMLLCCMKDRKPKHIVEIEEYMGLSASRISRIILGVEKKSLLERHADIEDKRQMIFSLTQSGNLKLKELETNPLCFRSFLNTILER